MAFGDGVPEEAKKKRMFAAVMAFAGDVVAALVFLLLMVPEIGDIAYIVAAILVASGVSFLYVFPRLPVSGYSNSTASPGPEKK